MLVNTVKTRLIRPGEATIEEVITESLPKLEEGSVVVISLKAIALCMNCVVPKEGINKDEFVNKHADLYVPESYARQGFKFTIVEKTLTTASGIDESNADGYYVVWPENLQKIANDIRRFLQMHYEVTNVGLIISDSNCLQPLRRGTMGISVVHSGFKALYNLVGTKDLFGREYKVVRAGIAAGLAAAANVVMGEGAEQTPIAIVSDVPFVEFLSHDPDEKELDELYISLEDDMYAPFLLSAPWVEGGRGQ